MHGWAPFQAGEKHVKAGQKLRADGKLDDAMQEFQRALITDPSSAVTLQEIKRTQQMMQQNAKPEDRGMTPVEIARRDTDKRIRKSIWRAETSSGLLRTVGPLKINNQPVKVLLLKRWEKVAGVNVLFDSQFTPNVYNWTRTTRFRRSAFRNTS